MAAEHVDAKLKLVERRRRSLGSDVSVEHNAIAAAKPLAMHRIILSRLKILEKATIAHRSDPTKALPMQNVLKQSMHCGVPVDSPYMCARIIVLHL